MKRLTKYDEFGNAELVGIDNAKLYERLVCDETVALTIATNKLGELEDVLEKYGIENAEELDKFIYHKDCQIDKWKQDYENCSKLEKIMTKEHQYCLDNWIACEQELAELKQKAIIPKYKLGQEVWYYHIARNKVYNGIVEDIQWRPINGMYYRIPNLQRDYFWIRSDELFATKEEAEQSLLNALENK